MLRTFSVLHNRNPFHRSLLDLWFWRKKIKSSLIFYLILSQKILHSVCTQAKLIFSVCVSERFRATFLGHQAETCCQNNVGIQIGFREYLCHGWEPIYPCHGWEPMSRVGIYVTGGNLCQGWEPMSRVGTYVTGGNLCHGWERMSRVGKRTYVTGGNLFTIAGRMKCALTLSGRKIN